MEIPFFELNRQYDHLSNDLENKILETVRSKHYIEGEAVHDFEEQMCEYLKVTYAVTCNSGTDALRIALQSVGVSEGDEVITTPFTFFATAEAIMQIGAIPVFADIDPQSLNISPDQIERKITNKTKAILPVHIFGMPADMNEINEIGDRHGVRVIEDACQAIGAEYHDKKTGVLADAGCFSFYPTKNLGCFGDGGMITTNDKNIAMVARALKNHGAGRIAAEAYGFLTGDPVSDLELMPSSSNALYDPCKYYNYLIGGNSRLDSIQAAILSVKLRELNKYIQKRCNISERYTDGFNMLPVCVPQTETDDRVSCRHQYALLVDDKYRFIEYMSDNGIGTGTFYPIPLHLQRVFEKLGYKQGDLPVSEDVCNRSVCLPIFPELSDEEVDKIIKCVQNYYNR